MLKVESQKAKMKSQNPHPNKAKGAAPESKGAQTGMSVLLKAESARGTEEWRGHETH
jgi:hypothetical protein